MKLSFEHGNGMMEANLPDDVDVFIPGETIADPEFIPTDEIEKETLKSLQNPIGMEPLSELANEDSTVTIVFPDRVKGGEQETAHRKVSIKLILKELYKAGVKRENILLICSNGLHRKNTDKEIRSILGNDIYDEFAPTGQIFNHDSEDYDNLVDLGETEQGDPVIMNKYVFESDIPILIGHTLGNPYGGYSGGYKHSATGITHWKSIASHHVPKVMHRKDFTPVSTKSLMRTKFDKISMHMEEKMGKKFFFCDSVLDTSSRQIEIFSGYAKEMQPASWEVANKRTFVPFADKKYNVLLFGIPKSFHYGQGMGTNPIMMMQAISAQIVRHKRILSDNLVIIASAIGDEDFSEENWPYMREIYDMFQKESMNILPDMNRYGEYFARNEDYINKYRFANAYHPFHGFSMMSSAHIAEKNSAAIYVVGAEKPGYIRSMGIKTRASFEEALEDAKKIVGDNPNILALPETFKKASVHLMMEDEIYNGEEFQQKGNH